MKNQIVEQSVYQKNDNWIVGKITESGGNMWFSLCRGEIFDWLINQFFINLFVSREIQDFLYWRNRYQCKCVGGITYLKLRGWRMKENGFDQNTILRWKMPCLRKSSFSKILNFKKAIRQLSQSENRATPTTKTISNNLIGSDSDLALLVDNTGHHRPISNAATSTPITNSRSDLIGRRSIDSSSTRVSEQSSATSSPLSMARSNLKKSTSRQRSFRGEWRHNDSLDDAIITF